jgi:predicted phosphate transport protein (TIGR00153 family)
MEKVAECAEATIPLFEHLVAGDSDALAAQAKRVADLESEADLIKNQLRGHLPKRLFLPVDRRDLLEILDLQDSVADVAEDIGDLLSARSFEVPEEMAHPLLAFVRRSVDAASAGQKVMGRLDELVEVGFSGPEVQRAIELIDEVLSIEDEADLLELEVSRILFRHEDQMSAVSVILWLRIFDHIGDLADYPKKVCNRLRLLIAS